MARPSEVTKSQDVVVDCPPGINERNRGDDLFWCLFPLPQKNEPQRKEEGDCGVLISCCKRNRWSLFRKRGSANLTRGVHAKEWSVWSGLS